MEMIRHFFGNVFFFTAAVSLVITLVELIRYRLK